MMEAMANYMITVTAAALVCGIIQALAGEGKAKPLLRFVCGLFLTITAVSPLRHIRIPDFQEIWQDYQIEAAYQTQQGQDLAAQERMQYIKAQLEAYILDKAAALGVCIQAEIQFSGELPTGTIISGNLTQREKERLSEWITQELGITLENQQWIG